LGHFTELSLMPWLDSLGSLGWYIKCSNVYIFTNQISNLYCFSSIMLSLSSIMHLLSIRYITYHLYKLQYIFLWIWFRSFISPTTSLSTHNSHIYRLPFALLHYSLRFYGYLTSSIYIRKHCFSIQLHHCFSFLHNWPNKLSLPPNSQFLFELLIISWNYLIRCHQF